ncbi:hypothetical protein B0T13DRAFT_454581 [Neurospora crassa]|nr:hypothetical protein B0T13DRAFT_454581 [Neurospora crassa]
MKLSRFFFCWVSWASLLLACIGPSVSGGTRSNIVDAQCSVVIPLPTACIACSAAPSVLQLKNAKHFHL